MKTRHEELFSIGALARMSGVSVRTIRFYSDEGFLPPAAISESGYRYYSPRHLARLEAIRTLRNLDFDLPTIAQLLDERLDMPAAIDLQLCATETKLRALQRQRALLRIARNRGEDALQVLRQARALEKLDAWERSLFVRDRIDAALDDVPIDPQWRQWFLDALVFDPPDVADPAKLDAWLELVGLATDPSFLAALNHRSLWEQAAGHYDHQRWQEALARFTGDANAAIAAGTAPRDRRTDAIIQSLLSAWVASFGEDPQTYTEARMLEQLERNRNPRAERFWELVNLLRGARQAESPIARAFNWLIATLRARTAASD